MATQWVQSYKHWLMTGGALDLGSATLRWVVVDTALHTPSVGTAAGDEFLADVASGARIATSDALANAAVTDGVLDADDATLTDPGGGATGEALYLYNDTGNAATSRLIVFSDDATGLPLTLDGTNDTIQHNASGIAAL